ncbi:MAG TPA: nucleotide pyrophosphohydrolase [candidate division WOR-3 bacterium]|uniref:Nucleotide pyrophosphohydrolase n=1 Tax=candidate division WOR-3 bacterium TaxID=2052148 RepID=A0A7C1BE87_UNCW3|nr:nucleotide pyrophosphohydrolase [candidate division WOR-3 bacterium]
MTIEEFQRIIRETYYEKDSRRGLASTFQWFVEEVGELASALRKGSREDLLHEFSDVFAWLTSLANLTGVDMVEAAKRYEKGCPKCGKSPCVCGEPNGRK